MKRLFTVALLPLLLLVLIIPIAAAGCSSAATTTTPTTTTPGGSGGGLVVRSDSINTLRIESITAKSDGVTDMTVTVLTTQNVSDLKNPVADKVGQKVDVWTDEDVSGLKVGETINGHIEYAGDAVIGITLYLFDITK